MPTETTGGRRLRPLWLGVAASALALGGWLLRPDVADVFSLASLVTALSFFAGAFGHRRTAILLGSLLTLPGAIAIAQRLFRFHGTAETIGRALEPLGPVSGWALLLVGLALMASWKANFRPGRSLAIVLAGGSVASMAVAAASLHVLASLSSTHPFVTTALTIPEAITVLMLGIFIAFHGWYSATDHESPSLALPVAAGMSVLLAAVALAVLARTNQKAQIQRTTLIAAEGIGEQARRGLYAHLLRTHRAVEDLVQVRAENPAWESALQTRMRDYAGLEAVAHLDAPDRIRWLVPRTTDPKPVLEHAARIDWSSSSSTFVFEPIALVGGPGFLVYDRSPTRGEAAGFAVSIFRYAPLFAEILEDSATDYELAIFHDDVSLFERASPDGEESRNSWSEQIELASLGFSWRIIAWPKAETLQASRSLTALGSILMGNLVALLLALAVQLAQTARRRSEALLELNQELASQMDERRRAEEKLMQSQKMEAVGRLAGGVAHDFNNFLTVVHGYSELVRPLVRGEAPRRYIGEIAKASERASELTQQLLAFSRRQPRAAQPVDLNESVREVHGMLARLIGEHINLTLDGESSVIKADPGQLQQIIVNLAVNARDAMPQGGELAISTSIVELDPSGAASMGLGPGRHAELTVRDTGIGMSKSTMANMFEPFFTTKERGRGTGLGLSTVYGIVRQSGGQILATSTPGEGATFRVYFPLTEEPVGEASAEGKKKVPPSGYEATVLLVEDDEAVRDWIEEVLRSGGYRVLVARDGEEALSTFERSAHTIDLLITDVIMPRMGGLTLSEILSERRKDLPVLFVSGYPDRNLPETEDGESAYYLSKPFTASALLEKMRSVLDRARV